MSDRTYCAQCGQPYEASACGPTHAVIAEERRCNLIVVTSEERYFAEDALRRLRDVKPWDECQPIAFVVTVVDAINQYRRAEGKPYENKTE